MLWLALPVSAAAQANGSCGVEARLGLHFSTQENLDNRGPSVEGGFACDMGRRFGVGGDIEYQNSDGVGQFWVLGTGRMRLLGEPGVGAFVLRGHTGIVHSVETGVMTLAPLPPDFTGTTFDWDATGLAAGGGVRARADFGDRWRGFVEWGVRTALLDVRDRWKAGERVETESIFVTSFPVTAGVGVRF